MNTPLRFASILVCLFALFFGACASQQVQAQRVVASTFATAANHAGDVLSAAYRDEGLRVIAQAKTRPEAEAGLDAVRKKWAPVWGAWEKARAAQAVWATALESAASLSEANRAAQDVIATYCALSEAAKPLAPLPAAPGVSCPGVP